MVLCQYQLLSRVHTACPKLDNYNTKHDDLPKDVLEKMKNEILLVISKYVEFDSDDVEISLSRMDSEQESSPALVANIPIKHLR